MTLTWPKGICVLLIALGWQAAALAGDTLLIHGRIYTGNPKAPWASAISVSGTRIEAVGTDAAVLKHRAGHAQVIDLHGQTVIPGIVDSHTHMLYGAYALHGMNLSTPQSSITPDKPDLLVERLKAYAAAHPHDAVLFGRADFSTVPPTTPTHALLDRAVADRPVVIHNTSEHALWLNSAAVTGEPMDGAGQGGAAVTGAIYVPEERISVADAVRAYTQGSAYAAFFDKQVGTLEVGKLADLAVLSQDIFSVPPDTIGKTRVLTTMVGGKIVYTAAP
jgi:predicted amidohydrolase YtcJ